MRRILVRLDQNKKVKAQWSIEDSNISKDKPEPNLFDVTGRPDGPNYMGRTYIPASDSFTPFVLPPKTKSELLKAKTTWTATDRDNAIRELL